MEIIVDREREKLWNQLNDTAGKLGIPALPRLHIGLALHSEGGKAIMERREEGHTWTRNAWNILFGTFGDAPGGGTNGFGAGVMSGAPTSGSNTFANTATASRVAHLVLGGGHVNSAVGNAFGVIVGASDAAFNIDQINLVSQIAHSVEGATNDTLGYRAMSSPLVTYNAAAKTWTSEIIREFRCGGANAVTVREVGLVWNGRMFATATGNYLTARDVLASAVTVNPGQVLTVRYGITLDYSAID